MSPLAKSPQMNIKILKYVRSEGYCCMWAWLEANRATLTSELMKRLEGVCTVRALQYQRGDYRKKNTVCEGASACLKARLTAGHTIVLHPHKAADTGEKG